jgi:hypothetical protein
MASAFLWDDRAAAGLLSSAAGTVAAGMPVANLLDRQPRMRARWLGSAASVLVDFGTETTLEALALLSTSLRTSNGDTVRARLGTADAVVEAAPLFDLRFTSPETLTYPPGWTFSRASLGWRFNAAGVLVEEPANVPRFDYDPGTLACRGLLLEEARSNGVRNVRAEGAVAGTPGTLPTHWTIALTGGLSSQVIGTGTESGLPFLDLRISGSTSAAATATLWFEAATQAAAAPSQAWCASAYFRLMGGGWGAPSAGPALQIIENTAGAGVVATNTSPALALPNGAALATQRRSYSVTIAGVTTAFVQLAFTVSYPTATAVDFTLRIGIPQIERGFSPSSPILPPVGAPALTTRAADQTRVTGLSIGPATMLMQAINQPTLTGGVTNIGGWAPPNDFNNSAYFTRAAGVGGPSFIAMSGGVGVTRNLSAFGAFGQLDRLVGATAPGVVMAAVNAGASVSAASFIQPAGQDRASLGGVPWGNDAAVGLAQGVGVYARWALYPSRLSDAQVAALASTGSSRTAAGLAWDSGTLPVETDAASQGNVIALTGAAVVGRYLLVDIAAPGAAVIDLGRLVAGPLFTPARGFAYGAAEGREILDVRDRNPITGAEFPRPALVAPRIQRFTMPLISNAEMRTAWRAMVAALGGAGEALWIPDTSLSRAELAARCLWGAIAAGGEEATLVRDGLNANSRTFRIVERI